MVKGRMLLLAAGIAAFVTMASVSAATIEGSRKTMYLTFSTPVSLPGVTLKAGSYIFELRDPVDYWGVVNVSSRDRSQLFFSGTTRQVKRPQGMRPDQVISFGEAPAGTAQRITTWWPANASMGREFVPLTHK